MADAPGLDSSKILLAVDFSACSGPATELAVELATRLGASLGLIHVFSPPPFSPPETMVAAPGAGRETLGEHVRKKCQHDLDEAAREMPIRVEERHVEIGDPATRIVEHAERAGYGLIVMGTHGRTGLAHLALGSVAERVLRHASCPVLVVPCPPAQ